MAKNWLDKFDEGENTPSSKYNSIPTGILKPPTVIPTSGSSYYEPSEQTIYLNPTAYYNDPSVYQHEMFHHWQNLNDQLRKPDEYQGPLAKPNMLSNNTGDYYNRRTVETDKEYNDFYKDNPSFKIVNPNLIYNGVINPSLYENPKYAEGEAEDYQYYVKGGGRPAFMAKGGLIKRADGSYSKRGLWDNIRANRGSGRKPTAEMLRQERKIRKKEDGGWIGMYAEGDTVTNPPSELESLLAQYQAIQDQVNKGNINKNAYVENMRKIADDLIAKGFSLEKSGILPQSVLDWKGPEGQTSAYCIGTACNLADQAGDKFYPQGSTFFTDNSAAQDYARDNPNASRYLEQSEKFISPGDIIQFKTGSEKGVPYHAYTVYDIGQPNEDGDRIITVVGSAGHGPMLKKTYVLGSDNKIYSDYGNGYKGDIHYTQLLKRREDNTEYNNLLSQRDALKQQILGIDPLYFTPKEDVRADDYRQTGFELNDQSNANGRFVVNEGIDKKTGKPKIFIQAGDEYIDASNSQLTDIIAKYNDPQYKYDYMRTHNISSDEYDAVVKTMVGVYGAETKFGTDYVTKDKFPEPPWLSKAANVVGHIPFLNKIPKIAKLKNENRSIGPFQIKYSQLPEEYRKTIEAKDLYDTMTGAEATMENLTAGLSLLRKRANTTAETATENNPYSSNITKENYLGYLPYLNNMRTWLKGDKYTQEKYGDILKGEAEYKGLVDQFSNNVLQIIPTMFTTPQSLEVTPPQRNGGYVQSFKNGGCCNDNMYGDGGWIDMYNEGSWVADMSIPTPTTPSFYDAYPDRTLTNYQMGTDKAPMYKKGGGVNPIYVTDRNDPRLKAYNDSLSLYNTGLQSFIDYGKINNIPQFTKGNYTSDKTIYPAFNNIAGVWKGMYPLWNVRPQDDRWKIETAIDEINNDLSQRVSSKEHKKNLETRLNILKQSLNTGIYPVDMVHPTSTSTQTQFSAALVYEKPKQEVILEELKKVEPRKPKLDFSEDEDVQPIAPTRYVPDPVRRVMNPAFDFNVDFEPNRTKEAVVDQAGNPRYKYYNQDKVITEQEYKKLMQKKANGGPVMYGPGGSVNTLEGNMIANVLMNRNRDKDFVQRAYAVGENPNSPMFNLFDPEEFGSKMSHKMGWGEDDNGQAYMFPTVMNPKDEAIKVPNQYADYISSEGYKNATGIPMYNAGSTVWTNQNTPLWAAGTPTPTSTQNFRNTGSLNTSRYRIGDVIPTGMNYKTPAAGTYDYNKDVQPAEKMVIHAPDTLRIGKVKKAKLGGYVKNNNSNTWLDTYN